MKLFLSVSILLSVILFVKAASSGYDRCVCYCCPSSANSGGSLSGAGGSCDKLNPPLVGGYQITAQDPCGCSPAGCYSSFSASCPPPAQVQKEGGFRATCANCPEEGGSQCFSNITKTVQSLGSGSNKGEGGGNFPNPSSSSKLYSLTYLLVAAFVALQL